MPQAAFFRLPADLLPPFAGAFVILFFFPSKCCGHTSILARSGALEWRRKYFIWHALGWSQAVMSCGDSGNLCAYRPGTRFGGNR